MDELRQELTPQAIGNGESARMRRLSRWLLAGAVLLSACKPSDSAVAADSPRAARGDSIVPMEEALRRFRADLPPVSRLEGGADSRNGLVQAFIRAVENNDTAAVQRLHLSRAEYGYLYFPTSIYMNKPYHQDPALAWFLAAQNSDKGITRVLRRLGGRDLSFAGYECAEETREGSNTFWRGCTVEYVDPQQQISVVRRLFGSIIERDGRFKFLSYANDL